MRYVLQSEVWYYVLLQASSSLFSVFNVSQLVICCFALTFLCMCCKFGFLVMCIWKHKMHQTISPSLQTSCFQLKRRFKNLAVGGFCQRNCLMKIKKYILFDNEIFQYNFSFIIILWWFWYFCWHFSWSFYVQCIIQVFIMYVLMHLMFS